MRVNKHYQDFDPTTSDSTYQAFQAKLHAVGIGLYDDNRYIEYSYNKHKHHYIINNKIY